MLMSTAEASLAAVVLRLLQKENFGGNWHKKYGSTYDIMVETATKRLIGYVRDTYQALFLRVGQSC